MLIPIPRDLFLKFARSTFGRILSSVGMFVIGAGLLIYGLLADVHMNQLGVDLNDADWSTLRLTQHVEFDLDFLVGEYMYRTKNEEVVSRSYVVPDRKLEEEGLYVDHFLGLEADTGQEYVTYDKIIENSWLWMTDETGTVEWAKDTAHINGYLRRMNLRERKYMKEFLTDAGYTEAEIKEVMVPYVIVASRKPIGRHIVYGAFILIFGVVGLFFSFRRKTLDGQS